MSKNKATYLVCVNEKEHSKIAVHFACVKAKATKSNVAMLYVIDPLDYNTLFSVADVIKEERRASASKLLDNMAKTAKKNTGIAPIGLIREGGIVDEVVASIQEDPSIKLLMLAAAEDGSSSKSGLLAQLTEDMGDRYHIPLLIVPGNLTEKEIEALN